MKELYLDAAATMSVFPEVMREAEKYMVQSFGNPSSMHEMGEKASEAVNKAREAIAREIGAKPWEIYFTSCASESNNLAIQGVAKSSNKKKIILSSIEHPSVTEVCNSLKSWGYKIVKLETGWDGSVRIDKLEKEIDKDTLLVSVMHVNNVFGTIQDLAEVGKLCRSKGVLFHTDAVQSFSKLKIDVNSMNIDLLSASGHKIGGLKGAGFLYVRDGVKIAPILYGGGQEKGLRSGTENVSAIVGFARALEVVKKIDRKGILETRNLLIEKLGKIGRINGSIEKRIDNNIHVSFPNVDAGTLVLALSKEGIYVSAGSACENKKMKEDSVLKALGLGKEDIEGSIRITLSRALTEKEIDHVVSSIFGIVEKIRLV